MTPDVDAPVSKETKELIDLLIAAKRLADREGDAQLTHAIFQALFRLGQIVVARSKSYGLDRNPH